MNSRVAWAIALAVPLLAPERAHAQDKVFVALPAAFDFESEATAKLRKDCAIADVVSKEIIKNVKNRVPAAHEIDDWRKAGVTPVVRVWITQVQPGASYGANPQDWMNRMAIRAELYQESQKVYFGEWRASSVSMGDAVCPPFDRIAGSLGKNVATWIPLALRVSAANRAEAESAAKPPAQ